MYTKMTNNSEDGAKSLKDSKKCLNQGYKKFLPQGSKKYLNQRSKKCLN